MRELLRELEVVLSDSGMLFSERCASSPRTADLAVSGHHRLLLRVATNINSVTRDSARCMSAAGRIVGAEPVIIGKRGHDAMCDDAVYERHDVMAMTPAALSSYLDGDLVCKAERGGLTVNIGDLSFLRVQHDMSRGQLARALGVSVTMIRKYESGSSPSPAVAERLVALFGDSVLSCQKLRDARFEAEELNRAPFDIALKSSSLFLLSRDATRERVATLKSFAETLDAEPLLLGKKAKGIRTVELDELLSSYSC